jgi:uncharacterized protein (TIGR03067 family)
MGQVAGLMLLVVGAINPHTSELDRAGKALQGTWQLIRAEGAERELYQRMLDNGAKWTFQRGTLTWSMFWWVTEVGSYRLDSMHPRKHLDLMPLGHPFTGKAALALYSVENDILTVCYAEPGKPRPRKLTCRNGDAAGLIILRRVKP